MKLAFFRWTGNLSNNHIFVLRGYCPYSRILSLLLCFVGIPIYLLSNLVTYSYFRFYKYYNIDINYISLVNRSKL